MMFGGGEALELRPAAAGGVRAERLLGDGHIY